MASPLKLLIVAENVSLRQSGEASIGWYYLEHFLRRGHQVQLVCHVRARQELSEALAPDVFQRLHFIEDSALQKLLFAAGKIFPYRIRDLMFGQLIYVITQMRMRSRVKRLVVQHAIDIVFQPAPISPKTVSFMFGLGVPVVIGPMCGGLELPPAFRHLDGRWVTTTIHVARWMVALLHRFVPGKLEAAALLVGNDRTKRALPGGVRGDIHEIVESGVDLQRWPPKDYQTSQPGKPARIVFCGRLVDWKGPQYLIPAFAPLARSGVAHLDIIGDGELFAEIEKLVEQEGIGSAVTLHGRLPLEQCIELMRESDIYVMPSLRECGGLALLEAMCIGLPIVACNWLGPAEYLNGDCAFLIDTGSERQMIEGFTDAMNRLATSPVLARSMGEAARRQVFEGDYGWEKKVDRVLAVLDGVNDRRN